ncbi:sulfurtransferase [Neobacillus sp. SM06]|uniref:sulfurtransferase n=1 Tax=Neobacillus sp. SM06 TaxID=3422492 RepID=UPI003D26A1CF
MLLLCLILVILISIDLFKRYVPVTGISDLTEERIHDSAVLLDLRDYQTTYKCPICHSVNIPFAYLKRYYREIPNKKVIVLASDTVEKNLAIRFLLKKKFQIEGFMVINEKRGEKHWNMISKQKIV